MEKCEKCKFWNPNTMICSRLNHKINSGCHIDCHCKDCKFFKEVEDGK